MTRVLEVNDLVSGYGDAEVIHGVSVHVDDEEIVTVIGPNGAGKSTVMKSVFGLVDVWDGELCFRDTDLREMEPHEVTRQGLCYVPQTDNVFPNLSVRENLEMGAFVLDGVPEHLLDRVYEMFPVLSDRSRQRAGSLSGGQQQMLAMARALMVDPDLLMVDEPSAGLAPDLVDDVFEKIVQVNRSGVAVLMVEQNARDALRISDRGYVLEAGENRFEGTGDELLEDEEVIDLYLAR
ncbi:MAG: ABC transporter ATP-binding protein [Halobacteria archaeon]